MVKNPLSTRLTSIIVVLRQPNRLICRSTEGITNIHPKFQINRTSLKKRFIRGAYHYYRSDNDPKKQADNFPSMIDFKVQSIVKGIEKIKV